MFKLTLNQFRYSCSNRLYPKLITLTLNNNNYQRTSLFPYRTATGYLGFIIVNTSPRTWRVNQIKTYQKYYQYYCRNDSLINATIKWE